MNYKVVEKFISINGEGEQAGFLSVFIRFWGCNLSCEYCDTEWANQDNINVQIMSDKEIYKYVKDSGITHVTLTGGEPLTQVHIKNLLDVFARDDMLNVEIETNGSIDISPFVHLGNSITFTLDYKLQSSGMESEMLTDNYKFLTSNDTVKFVVGSIKDLNKAMEVIDRHDLTSKCNVHLSPVFGKINMKDIVEFMKKEKLNQVKFQPQIHKFIWNSTERGV